MITVSTGVLAHLICDCPTVFPLLKTQKKSIHERNQIDRKRLSHFPTVPPFLMPHKEVRKKHITQCVNRSFFLITIAGMSSTLVGQWESGTKRYNSMKIFGKSAESKIGDVGQSRYIAIDYLKSRCIFKENVANKSMHIIHVRDSRPFRHGKTTIPECLDASKSLGGWTCLAT